MSRLQEVLAKNGALKAAALGLALLLWIAVRIDSPATRTLENVPVTVELTDRNWAVRTPLPGPVTLHFEGATRDLLRLAGSNPSIVIPIEAVSGADTTVAIERDWIRLGGRLAGSVREVQPPALRLSFEPMESRSVPVTVRALGGPPEGLALSAPLTTVPRSVRLRGPATAVAALTEIPLEPLALGDYRRATTVTRAVDLTGHRDLSVTPDSVTVVITLEEEVERRIDGIPLLPDPRVGAVRLEADTVSIRVFGARSLVGRLDTGPLLALARPQADAVDTTFWTVRLEGLPELLRAEVDPPRVRIRPPEAP
ncbi:MAG: CdaR family protein [Gemmatimonadota bacterium]